MWLHKIFVEDSGNIIFLVFWRQRWNGWGSLRRPGRPDRMGGNDGRRT